MVISPRKLLKVQFLTGTLFIIFLFQWKKKQIYVKTQLFRYTKRRLCDLLTNNKRNHLQSKVTRAIGNADFDDNETIRLNISGSTVVITWYNWTTSSGKLLKNNDHALVKCLTLNFVKS